MQSRWVGAELHTIATQELAPYVQHDQSRVRIEGPQVLLEPGSAQAIAVVLHELATNAAKYGALSGAKGRVELEWSHAEDGTLALRWIEVGGPPVGPPTRRGFGSRVVERMISDLRGEADFEWRVDGLVCEITLRA